MFHSPVKADKGPLDNLWARKTRTATPHSTPLKQITKTGAAVPQTDATMSTETTQKPTGEIAKLRTEIDKPIEPSDGDNVRQKCFDTDFKAKSTEGKSESVVEGAV